MSYLVLARKWRPATFEEVVAQKHVTITLQNAIKFDRIANAYLFSGPRGVGKTTTARILAKSLNCEQGPTPTPCNKCISCQEITEGRSLDVFEIDGASNRGIDEVRNLRENIRYAPVKGRFKVYIIDEVHMLTMEAFNALLKTLEEPPRHVLFIFATTQPNKVPPTILSRCQRFDFKRIPIDEIVGHLRYICGQEGIKIDGDGLLLIAKKADGSMRDAQSLLDQAVSFSGGEITMENLMKMLGMVDQELFFEVSDTIAKKDVERGLQLVERVISEGYDMDEFLSGLTEHFRNLLIVRSTNSTDLIQASEAYKEKYAQEAQNFLEGDLLRLITIASDAEYAIRRSPNPRLRLEMALLKMIKLDRTVLLEDVIERIEKLKKGVQATDPDTPNETNSPPPQASGEERELERIKRHWGQIVEEVKKKRIAIGSFLQEGNPRKLKKDILEISFGKDNGFHVSILNKNKDTIQGAIREILNINVRVRCVQGEFERKGQGPGDPIKDLKEREPIVKKIIEEFEAELIR